MAQKIVSNTLHMLLLRHERTETSCLPLRPSISSQFSRLDLNSLLAVLMKDESGNEARVHKKLILQ